MKLTSKTTVGLALLGLGIGTYNLSLQIKPVQAQSANVKFQPFFDRVNNPIKVGFPARQQVDITPLPPPLNSFDQAVLKTCGSIGTSVSANRFKQLLAYYPDVFSKIQQVTGGELRPGRRSRAQFLDDLTAIWFNQQGFEHIFCGEIFTQTDIGGLHFYGRYLQLQNQGIGGRLPNNFQREEVVPGVIYTMGIVLKQEQRLVTDTIKGYDYLSNAQEILLNATRAFKAQKSEGACILPVKDQETGKSFQAVFVRKNSAIITFYPDATPKGKTCRI